ncbi:uncharacterized protein [Spinacia oleracea]|uniref:Uncharacterized protein isoform X1 n=1 Tax=Spinacia oleracea TaxID=3562 RepID=A0ABM3RC99_SPIOL|nr:uncharacterized protein LOC110790243 isoform X1 [Spinacia oleracea]
MNSDDLSLIEISSVEDSLLQQFPVNDFTFALSPLHLQIPKSHTISSSPLHLSSTPNRAISNTGIQVHGSVSTYSRTENFSNNDSKLGVPNLSVETQKMKRSKKVGGYNLRKSLAWDRAFFTEEGVLDDTELSLIGGTIGDRDGLSVIDEQGRDSLPVNSGSANLETIEENLFKELPSGYPNKRNATCKSSMKRDSISGGCLAPVSKSARKVPPSAHGLKKAVCKGEVCSSPVASVSQKRLSITGTKQISTRNSKIPKVPVSNKNPSVPSVTTMHGASAASGQRFKGTGIPQPARKSLSSKLSSKTNHASDAAKPRVESVPKSNKSSTDLGNVANSALQRHSLMSHRDLNTTKGSKFSENSSSQGRLSDGADVMSINETRSTKALSHVHFDNAGLNRNIVQGQGLKLSGLRMPSPSFRFFSETKTPVSNTVSQVTCMQPDLLKPSISTSRNSEVADHNQDLKPIQLLHGALNVDVKGHKGLCSQKTEECSTSSSVTPKVHSNKIQEKCNQQAFEVRVPVEDMNPEATKNTKFRHDNLDRFENQSQDQVPVSLKVEEKDCKDNKLICSDVELEEPSYKASILFPEYITAKRSMLDESCESNAEVQSEHFEEVEYNLTVMNNDAILELQTKSSSPRNNLMLAPDCIPSSSIIDNNRTSGESNSCGVELEEPSYTASILFPEYITANRSMLDESCESNAEVQSEHFEEVEYNLTVMDNDAILELQTKSSSPRNNLMFAPDCIPSSSIIDDNRTSGESNSCGVDQNNSQRSMKEQVDEINFVANGKSLRKCDVDDSAVPVCTNGVMAGQDTIYSDGVTGSCSANCSVAGGSKYKLTDCEQDEVIFDKMLSTMKLSESSEVQDKAIEDGDMQQRNSTNSIHDTKDSFSVNLDVLKMSSHCASSLPELLNGVPVDHLYNSNLGEGQSQFVRHKISGNCASVLGASTAYNQCTEITKNTSSVADKQQVSNNILLVKEMMLQSNEADSHYSILPLDSSFTISHVNNSTEEVKEQIDLHSCLSNDGDDSTLQTTHRGFQTSVMRSKDQVAISVTIPVPEESLCPVNKHEISPKAVLMRETLEECIEPGEPGCHLSPREARMKVSQYVDSLIDESAYNNIDAEDAERTDDKKMTRPPPNVVPFSDEWLAAIESAGEEILTLKTGAVKHSPPDKSVHEPSPWSPVKRTIGPFDCTKYTNTQPDNIN